MSKEELQGVWRTIRGRRVFIAKGESLGQAMVRSGKFKENGNLPKRSTIREAKLGLQTIDIDKKLSKEKNINKYKKLLNKDKKNIIKNDSHDELPFTKRLVENIGKNQDWKNKISEKEKPLQTPTKRVLRNLPKYSKENERELNHELVQKKLAEYRKKKGIKTSITSEEYNKRMNDAYNDLKAGKINQEEYNKTTDDIMDNYSTPRMNKEQVEKSNRKAIEDYKAKKQSNNIFQPTKEDLKEMQTYDRANDIKPELSNNKVDPYDDPESNESQRLQDIQRRYDDYLQDTEKRGASYGEIAYVESLRGKDLDDFEKELDDYEEKKYSKETNNKYKVKKYGDTYIALKNGHNEGEFATEGEAKDFLNKIQNNKNETIKNYVEKKKSNNKVATEIKDNKAIRNENAPLKKYNEYNKDEEQYREKISREIAKELNASLKNASENRLEKEAGNIRSYVDGEVLEKGEKPYSNIYGGLERSTKSLEKWLKRLRKGK